MSKITRRFFLGAGLTGAALFWTESWFVARPRAYAQGVWRRFHRWRTGMEPRWHEMSSATFHRVAVAPDGSPMPHKIIDNWRELRWPDNDELIECVTLESEMKMIFVDTTFDRAAGIDFRGAVEWHSAVPGCRGEMGARLPGPKCATSEELIDKVRHAAKYDFESNPNNDPEINHRNRWIVDAKDTVAKWDADAECHRADCEVHRDGANELMAALYRDALPMFQRMDEHDAKRDWKGMHWSSESIGNSAEVSFEYMGGGDLEMRVRKKMVTEADS